MLPGKKRAIPIKATWIGGIAIGRLKHAKESTVNK
jgi:hypothetical protein